MFHNVVYCGLISHSILDDQVVEGKHKPIVSKALFLKVHGIQEAKNHKSKHPEFFKFFPKQPLITITLSKIFQNLKFFFLKFLLIF